MSRHTKSQQEIAECFICGGEDAEKQERFKPSQCCYVCKMMLMRYRRCHRQYRLGKGSDEDFLHHMYTILFYSKQSPSHKRDWKKVAAVSSSANGNGGVREYCAPCVTRKMSNIRKQHTQVLAQSPDTVLNVDQLCTLLARTGVTQCDYCGSMKQCGLDRVDNTKGYDITNVVPCCVVCNMVKADMTKTLFRKQAKKISRHWGLHV